MAEPLRIVHVLGIMNYGGAETMVMNLYRNINRSLVQFDFVVHTEKKGVYDDEIYSLGGKIYHCPSFRVATYFKYRRWWKQFFSSHNYTIVHSHIRSTASIFLKIAKKDGIRTIIHSHSTSNGHGFKALVKKYFQRKLRSICDYFFACSLDAGRWLFGSEIVNDSNKFYILKNGIDISKYKYDLSARNIYRNKMNINEKYVYINVGRFHESKNHEFLIEIFNEIHRSNQNAILILVGDGELRDKIERKIEELNIHNSVIMVGNVNNVYDYLNASDCFLFPSRWEGLGMVAIEAQATGLKCICSTGVPEEVKITENCYFYSLDNKNSWVDEANRMQYIRCDNSDLVKKEGYDVSSTSNWLVKFYKGV